MFIEATFVFLLAINNVGFYNLSEGAKFSDLLQWCNDDVLGWISFNSTTSICFTCANETRLILINARAELEERVCCNRNSAQVISERTDCDRWPESGTESCDNGNSYISSERCDGRNDCGDGSDEKNCSNDCTDRFQCTVEVDQCFAVTQVCDNKKDCRNGSDEINCLYYRGRCRGFLCTVFQQCFPVASVCNGRKECMDGSDETGCNLTAYSTDFYCNSTTTIQMELLCDGKMDCVNGIDEENCYTWSPWGNWSPCDCQTQVNAERSRSRMCIKFNDFSGQIDSECNRGSATQQAICICTEETTTQSAFEATLETRWIVIIILSSVILLLLVIGVIVWARYNKRIKINGREIHTTSTNEEIQGEIVHEQPYDRLGNNTSGNSLSHTMGNSPRSVTTMPLPEPPNLTDRTSHLYQSIKISTDRTPDTPSSLTIQGNYNTTQIVRVDEGDYDHVMRSHGNDSSYTYTVLADISLLSSNGDNLSIDSVNETIVDPYRIERTPSESHIKRSDESMEETSKQTIKAITDPYNIKENTSASPSAISLNEQVFSSHSRITIDTNAKTRQRSHSQPIIKMEYVKSCHPRKSL